MGKLTKREAIRECKRKYRAKEGGLSIPPRFNEYKWGCPLCEYVVQNTGKTPYLNESGKSKNGCCIGCPIVKQYRHSCDHKGTSFRRNPHEFARLVFGLKE